MENTSSVIDTTGTELPILEEPVTTEPTVTEEVIVTEPTVTEEVIVTEPTVTEEVIVTEPTVTEEVIVTEPTVTEEVGPSYITSLEELLNTTGAIVQRENTDRTSLLSVFQPNRETLKSRLIIWASLGFPANWQVLSAHITPPQICSDGEIRDATAYSLYLLDSPIESFLTSLNTQVPGIIFSFFMSNVYTIGLSVTRV
jgi:hypothetical protein